MEIFEYPDCCVCNSKSFEKEFEFKYSSNEVLNKLGIAELPKVCLMRCPKCSHFLVHPQLNSGLLSRYYNILNSEFYDLDNGQTIDYLHRENLIVKSIVEAKTSSGRILEIGCGYGFLVGSFSARNWKRYAVEPSPLAAKYVKQNYDIDIQDCDFERATFESDFFDVVMLFDVLEHLKNPGIVISKIRKILKPGGYVYFGTGNIQSVNARMARNNWAYFGSWEHISFFTQQSITTILRVNELKFVRLIKRSHQSGIKNHIVFLKNIIKFLLRIAVRKERKFGLAFDHMIIVAQKDSFVK